MSIQDVPSPGTNGPEDGTVRLGRAERMEEVRRVMERTPWLSDREIARRLGLGHPTVGRYRHALGIPRAVAPKLGKLNEAALVWALAARDEGYDLAAMAAEVSASARARKTRADSLKQGWALLQRYIQTLDPDWTPTTATRAYTPPSEAVNVNQERRGT